MFFLSKIIAISISEADPAMAFCFRAAPSKLASHKKKVILCFLKISATYLIDKSQSKCQKVKNNFLFLSLKKFL